MLRDLLHPLLHQPERPPLLTLRLVAQPPAVLVLLGPLVTNVLAWRVDPEVYSGLQQGQTVRALVTRFLGHVRSVEATGEGLAEEVIDQAVP